MGKLKNRSRVDDPEQARDLRSTHFKAESLVVKAAITG
jgi:hypothetical protein